VPDRLSSNSLTDVELISSPSIEFGPLFKNPNTVNSYLVRVLTVDTCNNTLDNTLKFIANKEK